MGCSSCGTAKNAGPTEPWEVPLADGTKVMVTSKAQERAEKDKAFVRVRAQHRANGGGGGYTVTR